jgi:hypothetical protein
MQRLGIEKKSGKEFTLVEWEALKNCLSKAEQVSKQKEADAEQLRQAVPAETDKPNKIVKISCIDTATMRARLAAAKQEYDYNKMLITMFQSEAHSYFKSTGKTTMMTHNGSMSPIPAIVNLEKFVKLNIALSKQISDLESDLDIGEDSADDPFV